ncbi:hypothetical protein EZS27_001780 [termite gut metagenome]|jgi:hypothetical protein|uniref:Uncharacterized protein n=1 Tax=termite gut metagenome TaxID=433724 RepID=A0A5J4SZW8_9ZZZZ
MIAIIEILIGFFIWLALPQMIIRKKERNLFKKFIRIFCLVVGIIIIIYGMLNLLKIIFDF